MAEPASERTTLRRGADRAVYDRDRIRAILAEGIVAHVGVATDEGPMVLPMAYGVDGDTLYLHGAVANALLRSGRDADVCVTVTLLDGLVLARNPFHNTMAYRSVVVRGAARLVQDPAEQLRALEVITDHAVDNWQSQLLPTDAEVRRTQVVAVPLDEASAKVRPYGPVDGPGDVDAPVWAGTVPIRQVVGQPIPAQDLPRPAPDVPAPIAALTDPAADGSHVFTTERLVVRHWTAADASAVLAMYGNPEVARWTSTPEPMVDLDQARDRIAGWEPTRDDDRGFGIFAIVPRRTSVAAAGDPVGLVLLRPLQGSDDVEIGWSLRRSVHGNGYATEAVTGLFEHARRHGHGSLRAIMWPDNQPSAAVCSRVGMRDLGEVQDPWYGTPEHPTSRMFVRDL